LLLLLLFLRLHAALLLPSAGVKQGKAAAASV
jgi:hypothetical protein